MRDLTGRNNPAWRPLEERFWERVDKNGPTVRPELGPCWLWTAANCTRYGTINVGSKTYLAHRVAWYLETGRWPEPCALHKCDNTHCVRFSHLFEGTQQDNVDDREAKGRNKPPRGEAHGQTKLTEKQVQNIRNTERPQRQLGREYGVSHATIGRIKRGDTWASL